MSEAIQKPRQFGRRIWKVGALLVLASAPPLYAQQTSTIVVRVVAAGSGEPIPGATVTADGVGVEAVTDESGWAVLNPLPPGKISVRGSAFGWAAGVVDVELEVEASLSVELVLDREAIRAPRIDVLLDRFGVVGSRNAVRRINGSAHYLGIEDLREAATLHDDVHALLREVPGLTIQEEDGYGLRPNIGIRGTGSERSSKITVMEDGVLIAPAPYAAPAAYYSPVAGRMSAIEVRKGSSQIKYGPHTIGGAVNFVSTPIPEDFNWFANIQGGQDETGKIFAGLGDSGEHFGWLAETYRIRTDGFKQLDGGGDTGFEIQDYLLKFRLNSSRDEPLYHELEVKAGYYDETSNETYLGLTEADFRASPLRRYPASASDVMRADHHQIQARYAVRLPNSVDVTTVVYRNAFARNWYKLDSVGGVGIADVLSDPDLNSELLDILRGASSADDALTLRANNREYTAQGVQSIVGWFFLSGPTLHELEAGMRFHSDEEDRFQHEDGYRIDESGMVLTSSGAPGSQSNRVSEASAWAFFAQDRIEIGRFSLTPGIRFETIDFTRTDYRTDDPERTTPDRVRENQVSAVIPGVGFGYSSPLGVDLFGGVHRGFGPPGPGADEATEPETSINYEAGLRFAGPRMSAQVVGFYNDYDNILGRATLAVGDDLGDGELFNGGEARVIGAEVSIDAAPEIGNARANVTLPLRLAYTYTSAEFGTSFSSTFDPWGDVEAGDELPYVPRHQLHATVGAARDGWSAELTMNHVGATRTTAGQGVIPEAEGTDSYTVWGLHAEVEVAPRMSIFGGIQNLTDAAYVVARRPAGARPGLPRTLLAGIRIGS